MDPLREQRMQLAQAILQLHDLYMCTGEEKKPMTISARFGEDGRPSGGCCRKCWYVILSKKS